MSLVGQFSFFNLNFVFCIHVNFKLEVLILFFYAGTTSEPQEDTTTHPISLQLIGSSKNVVYNYKFLENMDATKIEELGPPLAKRTVRDKVKSVLKHTFEGLSIIAQAQLLRGLIKHKSLTNAVELLGIKSEKEVLANEMVTNNVTSALGILAKGRSNVAKNARRALLTGAVAKGTSSSRLMSTTSKLIKTSRKSLWRHSKFRTQIDENDEGACWANICRRPYHDRLPDGVRDRVKEFWDSNSRVSPNEKDQLRRRISKGVYESHSKHITQVSQVELFERFMESNIDVKISLSTFVKLKPWYVRPITVRDTCCCRYHVEFELLYETFVNFGIKYWSNDPPPSSVREFLSKILCPRENNELFYKKECVGGRKCDKCSHLALYDEKYPLDPNDPRLSNFSLNWKRYEYVTYTPVAD